MMEEWEPLKSLKKAQAAPITRPDPAAIEHVAGLLRRSTNPVITADSSGRTPEGFHALVSLAESLAVPVVESGGPMYANFPNRHPLHHGYNPKPYLEKSDLVLVLGNRAPWYPPSAGPSEATVVVVDEYPLKEYMVFQDLNANVYLEGSIPTTLQLLDRTVRSDSGSNKPHRSRTGCRAKACLGAVP